MMNLVCTIVLLSALSFCQAANKLKVSIYYESLCPPCIYFIQNQVHPVYNQLEDYFQLDLVPFGNANFIKVGNKREIVCQHGPEECYGNVIHACALDSSTTRTALDFIACCEGQTNHTSDETFQKCATKAGIDFEGLKRCKETKGDDLLASYGERTKKVGIPWTPCIIFNDKYDKDIDIKATEDLKSLICEHLGDNKPKECFSHLNETRCKA